MSSMPLSSRASDLRYMLTDARALCAALGLDEGAQAQYRGLKIRCPWHADRTASCSVRLAPDGTLSVHCFGCPATGDALDLVAVAHRLDCDREFPEVLRVAATLAGVDSTSPRSAVPLHRRPVPQEPERTLPPATEVAALWNACLPVGEVDDVAGWLCSRGLRADAVEDFDLARALPGTHTGPPWARTMGRPWSETGHRLIVPMFDEKGAMRSVRARRVAGDEGGKAVAPVGFSVRGLVMADGGGRALLGGREAPRDWPTWAPSRLIVAEGEPDFLTWAARYSDADETVPAVLGVVSQSWTSELASRVPDAVRVIIRTHADPAGEKYARAIQESLGERCTVLRAASAGGVA